MASNNEAKIKFSADVSDFNSSIKEAKDETKQLNAEMRLNEATFRNTGDSAEYLANKHDLLEQKLKANQQQQEALNGKIETATEYFGEDSEEVAKLELELTKAETAEQNLLAQIDSVNGQIEEQASEAESSTSALDQLTQTISDQETELASLKDEYVNAVLEYGETSDEAQTLAGEIENLSGELQTNKDALSEAQGSADQFDQSMGELSDSGVNVGSIVPGAFGNIAESIMTGGIAGLVAGITDNIGELIQAAWDMANEWQESQAAIEIGTGLVGDELDNLTEKAYEAAGALADVNFDGSTSADVIAELNTRLGLTGDEAAAVTAEIGKFAKANGEDAVPAVDTLVNMMHRYGLETDELPNILDKLTYAQQSTQYSASDMADAIEKNAPSFKALGFSMDESLSYMMAFADYSDTTYTSAMTGTKKAVTALSEATDDVPGAFNEAIAVMQSGADMSTILNTEIGDTGKTISDVFGKKSAQDMVDFFQNGTKSIDDYLPALQECEGQMQSTYDNTVTLKDQNAQTWNAIKGQVFGAVFGSDGIINSLNSADTNTQTASGNMSMSVVDFGNTAGTTADQVSAAASGIDTSMSGMSDSVSASASDASTNVSGSFAGMGSSVDSSMGTMQAQIAAKNAMMYADISQFATNSKNDATTKFDTMKQNVSTKFEDMKTSVKGKADTLKSNLSTFGENTKTTMTTNFETMKNNVQTKFENMRSTVSSKASTLGSALTTFGSNAKTSISDAFENMKTKAGTTFETMRSTISTKLSNIKSLFNFSWSLPRPKIPSIDWYWKNVGGIVKIPAFTLSWHAQGGIFNQPTLLQSLNGNWHGVGEAGSEAIIPLDTLWNKIDSLVESVSGSGDVNNVFNIYASPGMNVKDVAREVEAIMTREQKQRAAGWT